MPRDTNADGHIFGGFILSLIDQAAYVECMRQSHGRYVTVAFHQVDFREPVYVGDLLSLYAEVDRVGRTSLTVKVRVCARRRREPEQTIHVTEAEVVYVKVDESGRPIPVFNAPKTG